MARQYTRLLFTIEERKQVDDIIQTIFREDRAALEMIMYEPTEHPEYFWQGWEMVSSAIDRGDDGYWNHVSITKPTKRIPFGGIFFSMKNKILNKRTILFYMTWKRIDGILSFAQPLIFDEAQQPWSPYFGR